METGTNFFKNNLLSGDQGSNQEHVFDRRNVRPLCHITTIQLFIIKKYLSLSMVKLELYFRQGNLVGVAVTQNIYQAVLGEKDR